MGGEPSIDWRLHLKSSPERVFDAWTTDQGREAFWAERSRADGQSFTLQFINGQSIEVELVESVRPERLTFRYFGGSTVSLRLAPAEAGGCDLHLREENVPAEEYAGNRAGWVSVLLALKAALDFRVDLRGHDPARTWDQGFVDN